MNLEKVFDHVPWGILWEVHWKNRTSGSLLWASLTDLCPVALTPFVNKCFERLAKDRTSSRLPSSFNTFQFAYHPNHSGDALSSVVHLSVSHLVEKRENVEKLWKMKICESCLWNLVSHPMTPLPNNWSPWTSAPACAAGCWICSLTVIAGESSSFVSLSTGLTRSYVLPCTNRIFKYADDTTMVGLRGLQRGGRAFGWEENRRWLWTLEGSDTNLHQKYSCGDSHQH